MTSDLQLRIQSQQHRLKSLVRSYLLVRQQIEEVNTLAAYMEELRPEMEALVAADDRLRTLLRNLPGKTVPTNIDGEDRQSSDRMLNGTSEQAQFRRQSAKEQARRLMRLLHQDHHNGESPTIAGLSFSDVRKLAAEGELEVIQYLRREAGVEDKCENPSDPEAVYEFEAMELKRIDDVREQLLARKSILESTPAFRMTRLYFSNRERFVAEMKELLSKQAAQTELERIGLLSRYAAPLPNLNSLGGPDERHQEE